MGKKRNRKEVTDADIASFVNFHLKQIKKAFSNKLLVTVICRHPTDPDAVFFMSEDGLPAIKRLIDEQAEKAP